jgi:hypothetical protein
VYDYLANPRNLQGYLCGALPGDSAAGTAPARWAFRAEPASHRLYWQLLEPHRAEGLLDVYGDCSVSQLWLTVKVAPDEWRAVGLRTLMRTVLHRIRQRIEDDPHRTGRPALPRSA